MLSWKEPVPDNCETANRQMHYSECGRFRVNESNNIYTGDKTCYSEIFQPKLDGGHFALIKKHSGYSQLEDAKLTCQLRSEKK